MRRILVGVALLFTAAIPTAATSVSANQGFDDGVYIVTLRNGVSAADVVDDFNLGPDEVAILDENDSYLSTTLTSNEARKILRDSRVANIREEMFAHTMAEQTTGPLVGSSQYPMPWGLDRIDGRTGLDGKFTYTKTGSGVRVYVVDSGVNRSHLAFGTPSRVVDGWSYRANTVTLNNYRNSSSSSVCPYDLRLNRYDPAVFDRPTLAVTSDVGQIDNDGHGTHVAGTIAGALTGVAQDASIVPVRVLDSCGRGTESMILAGLRWIFDQHKQDTGLFRNVPAVINLSLGFESVSPQVDLEIQKLLGLGITVVTAAGNSTKDACGTTPAGTAGTLSIAAMVATDAEASYSNFGDCVDIFAPGTSVLSTWPYYKPVGGSEQIDSYFFLNGTSMAAPHVTGAVAQFLQSKNVTTTLPTDAWTWLRLNATCNEIAYHSASRSVQTPNRLLATEDAEDLAPCAPSSTSSVPRDRSVDVAWTEPLTSNGSAITGFTATATPDGQTCTTLLLSCTISGLTNKTAYNISVSVTNAIGTSTSAVTTSATPEPVPSVVINLSAAPQLDALGISWLRGGEDGNGVRYTATAQPSGNSCESTTTSCNITGLTNGVDYTVSVIGQNLSGTSGVATVNGTPNLRAQPVNVRLLDAGATGMPTVDWLKPAVDGVGITYVAVAEPGGITCTTTTTSCAFNNLVNGVMYTVTITGKNSAGESVVGSTMVLPDGVPALPVILKTKTAKSAMKLSWPVVTNTVNPTYVVTASPGGRKCTTKKTSCTITKLKNGTNYTFSMTTKSPTGKVSASSLTQKARPGFTVKKTEVALRSRTTLGAILTTISNGKKTWSESGSCTISAGRLVAPRKKSTCVVTLRVARTAKYPAMSTRVSVVAS